MTETIGIINEIKYNANNGEILYFKVETEDKTWGNTFMWNERYRGFFSVNPETYWIQMIEACK